MTMVVNERLLFIQNIVGDTQLNSECKKHIEPPHIAEPTYVPLTVRAFSGAFMLLLCSYLISLLVFIKEICEHRFCRQTGATFELDTTHHFFDMMTFEGNDELMQKYDEFLRLLNMYSL
jgi:hypothetical protein